MKLEKKKIQNLIRLQRMHGSFRMHRIRTLRSGAALLGADAKIYTGCNIENAAFTPGNCAERTAIFKAVSEGCREFSAIAIVGGKLDEDALAQTGYTAPCGVCRQVLREFVNPSAFAVILARTIEAYKVYTLEELLPESFGPENLK